MGDQKSHRSFAYFKRAIKSDQRLPNPEVSSVFLSKIEKSSKYLLFLLSAYLSKKFLNSRNLRFQGSLQHLQCKYHRLTLILMVTGICHRLILIIMVAGICHRDFWMLDLIIMVAGAGICHSKFNSDINCVSRHSKYCKDRYCKRTNIMLRRCGNPAFTEDVANVDQVRIFSAEKSSMVTFWDTHWW